MTTFLIAIILLSGLYMAWNIGANDVANAMGTSVGSGALSLRQAVLLAAVLEFSGAFFFGSHVSRTIQEGIVNTEIFTAIPMHFVFGMLASLLGAGVWLQIASYFGWPVSTTHSIVGAIVGFAIAVGGFEAIQWENVAFIGGSWVFSPVLGGFLAFAIFSILRKKIFYSNDPLNATKKLTPILLFLVTAILTLGILYEGIPSLHFSFWQALLVSFLIGGTCSVLGHHYLKRYQIHEAHQKVLPNHPPGALENLEKARKSLQQIRASSTGELNYHVSLLVEEVEGISETLKHAEEMATTRSDYIIVEKIFGKLQLISACLMAFAHGANDVANAIGPLAAAIAVLTSGSLITDGTVPTWALALGGIGIVIGLATWGWRVIETIGKKLTELTPTRGFAAEFSAALTILIASRLGMPISATHTLVGAVLGVGFARGIEALNLATARDILVSWLVTIPIGAGLSIGFFYLINASFNQLT